jgi:hypothetical protein
METVTSVYSMATKLKIVLKITRSSLSPLMLLIRREKEMVERARS